MNLSFNISKAIDTQFDKIAKDLFHSTKIVVNEQEYFITEIEFYVFQDDKHPDPFVHKNKEQLKSDSWYFHGSGIDITIGDTTSETYGGILIRGLKKISSDKTIYIDGPLNILRELFSHINLIYSMQRIGLATSNNEITPIFKAPRIGLNPKNKKKGIEYYNKKYRYLIDLIPLHKYKAKEQVAKNGQQV